MSVRSSLLAILTMGPAYGFQLHGELESRTAGRRAVNVGQIYGTLDRLVRQGAVESAGTTEDALPLYRLTDAGRDEAMVWLHSTESSPGEEWNDLVNRVLLASSLPAVDALSIVAAYRDRWETPRQLDDMSSAQGRLAGLADRSLAAAALDWLDQAGAALAAEPSSFAREFSTERPRRGRRPAATAA